jgi:hypothetical protein
MIKILVLIIKQNKLYSVLTMENDNWNKCAFGLCPLS